MPKELESVGMGPGRGGLPPRTPQDADEFLENVDEVNALIDGLRSGKISAEYVDRKIKERDAESTQLEEERKKEAEEAERRKYENLSPEEQKKIKAKVDEMIAEKERRERARKAFHEYRAKMPEDKRRATDYDAWDLWTPSDDEDDPWMQYTPENPAFKAMEADIDRRHAAQVRARQTAHRRREEGNAAFRAGHSPTRSGATSSVSRRISARWSCTATPRWRRSSARCSCSASTTRPRRASWRNFSSRGPTTRRRSSACSGEPPRGSSSRTTRTRSTTYRWRTRGTLRTGRSSRR